jgi:hypothetical protein
LHEIDPKKKIENWIALTCLEYEQKVK